jgi:hypothetical protein
LPQTKWIKIKEIEFLLIQESRSLNSARSCSLLSMKMPGEDRSLPVPGFWWLQAVLCVLGLAGSSLQSLPLSSHVIFHCVSHHLPMFLYPKFPLLTKKSIIRLRVPYSNITSITQLRDEEMRVLEYVAQLDLQRNQLANYYRTMIFRTVGMEK